jgi:hypothetical protein
MDVLGEMIQAIERAARLIDEYLQAPFRGTCISFSSGSSDLT